jgi:trk system potassium uptake protein TrkH
MNALFTSTSAVCVTGLTVLDTAKDFTFLGQVIIPLLIQFGGLGIMTFSIAILLFMGRKFSIKWRVTFGSLYNDITDLPIKSVLKRTIVYSFAIELAGAAILFTQFIQDYGFSDAVWHSVFHSISAFCNAGFSTFSNNIESYFGNTVIILTLSFSIIFGGLGFLVLTEIFNAKLSTRGFFRQFSLHTRLVLLTSLILLAVGTLSFLFLEWDFVMKGFTIKEKFLTSFFHSTSARTAGFNSINCGRLREGTLTMLTALMFCGGSPGSIAGGVKTTTVAAIFGLLVAKFKGARQVVFWGKALDPDTIDKSTTLVILASIFLYASTSILMATDYFDLEHSFTQCLFEVASAFNTVGLSTGITMELPEMGKLLLSFVMFCGRLGPLVLIAGLTEKKDKIPFDYATEQIMIG